MKEEEVEGAAVVALGTEIRLLFLGDFFVF